MLVAVITLAVTLLAAVGGMIWAMKAAANERKRADNAVDLYNAQLAVKNEIERDLADKVSRLAAAEKQLAEAKAKIVRLDIALAKEQERNQKQTAERISRAPNPLDELTAVMREHAEVPKAADTDRAGGEQADSLLNTTLK